MFSPDPEKAERDARHRELMYAGHELRKEFDAQYKGAIFFTACASAYSVYMLRKLAKELQRIKITAP